MKHMNNILNRFTCRKKDRQPDPELQNLNGRKQSVSVQQEPSIRSALKEKLKQLDDAKESEVNNFVREFEESRTNISYQLDNGNTIVHIAANCGKSNVLKKLIERYGCEQVNGDGDTPIITALKNCEPSCVIVLVHNNANLFKTNKEGLNAISYATKRETEKRNQLLELLFPKRDDIIKTLKMLYDALEIKDDSKLLESLKGKDQHADIFKSCMQENYTLLQRVCMFGMKKSLQRLTELGVDLHFAPTDKRLPIQLACIHANPQVLKFLIDQEAHLHRGKHVKNEHGMNLIHLITGNAKNPKDSKEPLECLKILLQKGLPVNEKDKYGKTPLHYAALRKNVEQSLLLLENNANINEEDDSKRTPLMILSDSVIKKYFSQSKLDQIIKTKELDDELKLDFDFNGIFNNKFEEFSFATSILSKIRSKKPLHEILEHPVLSVIVYFKWRNIRPIYCVYLITYFFFCLLFSLYIYFSEDNPAPKSLKESSLVNKIRFGNGFVPFLINVSLLRKSMNMKLYFVVPLSLIIISFTVIEFLKIRNATKSKSNSRKIKSLAKLYLGNYDNLLRPIVLILTSLVILCLNINEMRYCNQLKAFSILALYIELYFVISKHPLISFYEVVFRRASWHLFRFITFHVVLLFGFAFSFHILFRSITRDNVFTHPLNALFKTIIMFTGEFDAGDIPFNEYVGVSHAIFVIYIFFVTIVLLNLMISIALKHYKEMERKPFFYQTLAQIDHIEHFEIFIREIMDLLQCENDQTETQPTATETGTKTKIDIEAETDTEMEHPNKKGPVILNTKTKKFETRLDFKMDKDGTVFVTAESKTLNFLSHLDFCACFNGLHNSVIDKAKNIAVNKYYGHNPDDSTPVTANILKNEINELKLYIETLIKS